MRSATQGEKAVLVKELREERYRLNDLLDAIGLSRPTCYYELGKTDRAKERNAELSSEISTIFNENRKRYGVRRVHHELLNRAWVSGESQACSTNYEPACTVWQTSKREVPFLQRRRW